MKTQSPNLFSPHDMKCAVLYLEAFTPPSLLLGFLVGTESDRFSLKILFLIVGDHLFVIVTVGLFIVICYLLKGLLHMLIIFGSFKTF